MTAVHCRQGYIFIRAVEPSWFCGHGKGPPHASPFHFQAVYRNSGRPVQTRGSYLVSAPPSPSDELTCPQRLQHGIKLAGGETCLAEIGAYLTYFYPTLFDAFDDRGLLFGSVCVLAIEREAGLPTG